MTNAKDRPASDEAGPHFLFGCAPEHSGLSLPRPQVASRVVDWYRVHTFVAPQIERLGPLSATVTAGLIYVLRDWRNQPHFYTPKGVESEGTQTMKVAPIERADWNLRRRSTGGLSLA